MLLSDALTNDLDLEINHLFLTDGTSVDVSADRRYVTIHLNQFGATVLYYGTAVTFYPMHVIASVLYAQVGCDSN